MFFLQFMKQKPGKRMQIMIAILRMPNVRLAHSINGILFVKLFYHS
jgi:hypothetical protein